MCRAICFEAFPLCPLRKLFAATLLPFASVADRPIHILASSSHPLRKRPHFPKFSEHGITRIGNGPLHIERITRQHSNHGCCEGCRIVCFSRITPGDKKLSYPRGLDKL